MCRIGATGNIEHQDIQAELEECHEKQPVTFNQALIVGVYESVSMMKRKTEKLLVILRGKARQHERDELRLSMATTKSPSPATVATASIAFATGRSLQVSNLESSLPRSSDFYGSALTTSEKTSPRAGYTFDC